MSMLVRVFAALTLVACGESPSPYAVHPGSVQVYYATLGEVEGVGGIGIGDGPIRDACELAAELGADAIVITGTGSQLGFDYDIFHRRADKAQAKAIQFR